MTESARPRAVLLFPEQHSQAATALGRAFINDPATWALLPDVKEPVERAKRIGQLFSVAIQINRRVGPSRARRGGE